MKEVGGFFDDLARVYNSAIERCVPRYDEMLDHLVGYVPDHLAPRKICELGCGTGNLTRRLAARWPDAEILVVDVSQEMLDICQQTLGPAIQLTTEQSDFDAFEPRRESLDLVVSSISIHHLNHDAKGRLFERLQRGLREGGVLTFSDQMAGVTPATHALHMSQWREWSLSAGASEEEWRTWMQHQDEHDYHESYEAHYKLLTGAGFIRVDCLWRNLLWTIVQAHIGDWIATL